MADTETGFYEAESSRGSDVSEVAQDAERDPTAEHATEPAGASRRRLRIRVALVVYVAVLFWFAFWGRRLEPTVQVEDLLQLLDWAVGLLLGNMLAAVQMLGLGLLVTLALGNPTQRRPRFVRFERSVAAVLAGMGLFVLLSLTGTGRPPTLVAFVMPLIGYLIGMWIGRTCLRGRRAVLWLVPKLGLLAVAGGLGIALIAWAALDHDPLPFESPKVTPTEKRRLAETIKDGPRTAEGYRRIGLSERDVNLLLAMAMPRAFPDGKATVSLDKDTLSGKASIRIPDNGMLGDLPDHINVRAACDVEFVDERVEVRWRRFRVGRISVPRFLVGDVWPPLIAAMYSDDDTQRLLASIGSLRVEPDLVEVTLKSRGLGEEVLPSLLTRLGRNPNVLPRVRIHYRHLVESAETLPRDDRFMRFVQTAFAHARQRSETEDPVLENRAAILALAIMHGHWRVENLVGRVSDGQLRRKAWRHRGRVALRGRRDWGKHFLVSAALTLLSNEFFSDEAGLFKEEIDATEGGSGFSFSDLLADRAGVLFATAATRDERAARAMQERLADGFEIDAIFPEAADLPEGIPESRLQAEYGGVGGTRYNEITMEIERRLATCAALR